MTTRARRILFFVGAFVLAVVFAPCMLALPKVGSVTSGYADLLNRITPDGRHATDVITAINFDYRAVDTLGEEAILFAAIMGVAMILRHHLDERSEAAHTSSSASSAGPKPSEAISVLAIGLVGATVLFGLYIVAHGELTPGGGFQGGVILASAPLVAYLSGGAQMFRRLASPRWVRGFEALGLAAYVATGALGFVSDAPFLRNVLPLGTTGDIFSAGTISVLNATTGMAVSGGFLVLLFTFVEELGDRSRGR